MDGHGLQTPPSSKYTLTIYVDEEGKTPFHFGHVCVEIATAGYDQFYGFTPGVWYQGGEHLATIAQ